MLCFQLKILKKNESVTLKHSTKSIINTILSTASIGGFVAQGIDSAICGSG